MKIRGTRTATIELENAHEIDYMREILELFVNRSNAKTERSDYEKNTRDFATLLYQELTGQPL